MGSQSAISGRGRVWRLCIFFSMVLWLAVSGFVSAGPKGDSDDRLAGYAEQLDFIRSEIKAVEDNLTWLMEKIKHLEDFDRFVPPRMTESVQFKKEKLESLKKLAARYEKLGAELRKETRTKENKKAASALESRLMESIRAQGLEDWVALRPEGRGVRLDNILPILFSAASAEVPAGYKPFIRKLAALVKTHKGQVVVGGYADTDPIRTEKYPSNFELGAARAGAVVRTFVGYGASPASFQISSTGAHNSEKNLKTAWKSLQRHVNISIFFQ